jgi:DNA-binding MarR family transcriptional regulator
MTQPLTARKIVLLGNAITNRRNRKLRERGLTSPQGDAIRCILKGSREGEVTAGDVMEELKRSQSTVAGILARLEEKGLILRCPHSSDARKSVLLPSPQGRELEGYLKESGRHTEELLLAGMTPEEQREFNRLLQKALDNMASAKS